METKIVGKKRIFLPKTNSTNSYAIELLKNVKPDEGTLVYTDVQTEGRGQRGMVWKSDSACNLTFSVILLPTFLRTDNSYYLYKIAALACYDTLANFIDSSQFDIKIKWPNDILVNRRKIGGILIENSLLDQTLQWSIMGVGLNINQHMAASGLNATSMVELTKKKMNRMTVLDSFCAILETYYLNLKAGMFEEIDHAYFTKLFGVNEWCSVLIGVESHIVTIDRIHQNGLLVLKDKIGNHHTVDVKEVTWLLNPATT